MFFKEDNRKRKNVNSKKDIKHEIRQVINILT